MKIPLFAPIKHLIKCNNRDASFQYPDWLPSQTSLECHYRMTVYENMCAMVLERAGGTKRVVWPWGPGAISTSADRQGITQPGVGLSALADRPQGLSSHSYVVKAPFPRYFRKRALSDSSSNGHSIVDSNSEDWQHLFTAELDRRLCM